MGYKKIISVISIMAMSLSIFTGCGQEKVAQQSNADTGSNEKRDFTLTMLYSDAASRPFKKDWKVLDIIKEHTGATIDPQIIPNSDYLAKKSIVFASGNIPDIVTMSYATAEDASSGLVLPISDYFDQMPNFKKYIEKNHLEKVLDNSRFVDGKVYTLPFKAHTQNLQERQWMVRKDIFEKNNIPIPTNLKELHDAGVKLKEIYPNSTPITSRYGPQTLMVPFSQAFGTLASVPVGAGAYYEEKSNKWVYAPTSDNWKHMLEYVNNLIKDGALDKEFSTLDSTVYEQRVTQGDTFIMYDWISAKARYASPGKKNNPDFNIQLIEPIKGEGEGNYAIAPSTPFVMGVVLPSSVKDKDTFKDILRFLDWCYSDEAEQLLTFGIEGEDCEKVDGIFKYKNPSIDNAAALGVDTNNLCIREHKDVMLQGLSKEEIDLFNKVCKGGYVKNAMPVAPLSSDQADNLKVTQSTLKDYTNSMMLKFIFGNEPLSNWDNFVKECKAKGSDKLIDEYNKGQAEKTKALKK